MHEDEFYHLIEFAVGEVCITCGLYWTINFDAGKEQLANRNLQAERFSTSSKPSIKVIGSLMGRTNMFVIAPVEIAGSSDV